MSVKTFNVVLVDRKVITRFIEDNHYSGNVNGCSMDYCFALYRENQLIGAMFYGRMAMAGQWKRFGADEKDVIELRRLVCVDDTPKNTESYFIGATLRWLKANTDIKAVVSYADSDFGHTGIVYRASNFKLEGVRGGTKVIEYQGRTYHDKSLRSKYKGELKPYALRLREALETGEAQYRLKKCKYCYVYNIRRNK